MGGELLSNSVLHWRRRTFMVGLQQKEGEPVSPLASAFLLGANYFLTSAHLLREDAFATVIIANETVGADWVSNSRLTTNAAIFKAEVVGLFRDHDIAFLRVEAAMSNPPRAFTYDDRMSMGASVGFAGYPFAANGRFNLAVTAGVIASLVTIDRFGVGVRTLQIDAMSNEGNSGGPLFLATTGALIGVMARRYDPVSHASRAITYGDLPLLRDRTNIAFAISATHIVELAPQEVRQAVNIVRSY